MTTLEDTKRWYKEDLKKRAARTFLGITAYLTLTMVLNIIVRAIFKVVQL